MERGVGGACGYGEEERRVKGLVIGQSRVVVIVAESTE